MSIQTLNLEGHLRDLATFREDHNLLPSIQLAAKTYFNSLSYDSNSHYISIKLFLKSQTSTQGTVVNRLLKNVRNCLLMLAEKQR